VGTRVQMAPRSKNGKSKGKIRVRKRRKILKWFSCENSMPLMNSRRGGATRLGWGGKGQGRVGL